MCLFPEVDGKGHDALQLRLGRDGIVIGKAAAPV
jgi:hypothetical protein